MQEYQHILEGSPIILSDYAKDYQYHPVYFQNISTKCCPSIVEHKKHVDRVLSDIRAHKLKISPRKSLFFRIKLNI